MKIEEIEERVKSVKDFISMETDIQLQKFSDVLREGAIQLANALLSEGETEIQVQFDNHILNKAEDEEQDTVSLVDYDSDSTSPHSRRKGIKFNRNDMANALSNFPSSIGQQPEIFTTSLPNLGNLPGFPMKDNKPTIQVKKPVRPARTKVMSLVPNIDTPRPTPLITPASDNELSKLQEKHEANNEPQQEVKQEKIEPIKRELRPEPKSYRTKSKRSLVHTESPNVL